MKLSRIYFLVILLNFLFYFSPLKSQAIQKSTFQYIAQVTQMLEISNTPPIAINDTFVVFNGRSGDSITGNLLLNDYDPDGDEIALLFCVTPKTGSFVINKKGEFTLIIHDRFLGEIKFEYYITEVGKNNFTEVAEVIIYSKLDNDYDNILDEDDIDDDNDGILDIDEGDGNVDSDGDGIPDSYDIDSDNDGITDNEEWQRENFYISPSEKDENRNGWDDTYDVTLNGNYYLAEDTDNDGFPDFIDTDSDEDGISDFIEGCDINNDGLPKINFSYFDSDNDGLDDAFDIIQGWITACNSCGSNAPLPDLNKNGIREWRDTSKSIRDEENFLTDKIIFVYPNPSRGKFAINLPASLGEQTIEFSLFSLVGKLLLQQTITTHQNSIDATKIDPGIYVAKFQLGACACTLSQRLIISR